MSFSANLLALGLLTSCVTFAAPSVDALIEAGHWQRARQIVEQRVQANPNDALAHMWLAKIKSGFNDLDGALADAEKAVVIDGKSPAYHGNLLKSAPFWPTVPRLLKASHMCAECGKSWTRLSRSTQNM